MIQSRLGLFEAYRHVLVALQKLATENSYVLSHIPCVSLEDTCADKCRPFVQKYLVEMDKEISAPNTLKERPHLDLRPIARLDPDEPLTRDEDEELCNCNVLAKFPSLPKSGMDESQLAACERMLTKSLAIVQVSSIVFIPHSILEDLISFFLSLRVHVRILVNWLKLIGSSRYW